jgi:serine/threonine protein phosphatase 1
MRALFGRLFRSAKAEPASRALIEQASWPSAVYAIGDIHGCLHELQMLESAIMEDGKQIPGEKWIVYLGDYVDRGPDSAGVLDHLLMRAPAEFKRICLAGNHEAMMLDFISGKTGSPFSWLDNGGLQTLQSYGIDISRFERASRRERQTMMDSVIPLEHREFLAECALALTLPGVTFVHAGLKPGIRIQEQGEMDLLWIRNEFLQASWPEAELIVHGHTPAEEPQIGRGRLGIDTGAFATGRLTAVRLSQSLQPHLMHVSSR